MSIYLIRIKFYNTNTAMLIVLRETLRHQHDTERTQNRAGCSHTQLFRPLWGSSVWRKNQRSGSDKKNIRAL